MMTVNEMNQIRDDLGLTYQDLCVRSGIPISTIQKILGGITKNPRINTMQRLERVLLEFQSDHKGDDGRVSSTEGRGITAGKTGSDHQKDYCNSWTSNYGSVMDVSAEKELRGNALFTDTSAMVVQDSGAQYRVDGSSARKIPHFYTAAEREKLPDDRLTELLDGVLYDMASPSLNHQRVVTGVYNQFLACMDEHADECEMFIAPADVVLPGQRETVLVPDLFITCDRDKAGAKNMQGAPDFVLEVSSPSTAYMDKYRKLMKYGSSGVKEYWIADPLKKKVIVYLFPSSETLDYDVNSYTFSDVIPVGISNGQCSIDMNEIDKRLK